MKKIVLMLIAVCILSLSNLQAQACDKTPECYSTAQIVTCGYLHGTHAYTHIVTEPNGYKHSCSVEAESSVHRITCSGCGAFLREENRTCNIIHSYCNQTKRYLCQY